MLVDKSNYGPYYCHRSKNITLYYEAIAATHK